MHGYVLMQKVAGVGWGGAPEPEQKGPGRAGATHLLLWLGAGGPQILDQDHWLSTRRTRNTADKS